MRSWLIQRIPPLHRIDPAAVSDAQVLATIEAGLLHRLLVCLDVLFGQFGSQVPDITISSRTALRCMTPATAPTWALLLGAALETRWAIPFVSYPGHMQGALIADYCRGRRAVVAVSDPTSGT